MLVFVFVVCFHTFKLSTQIQGRGPLVRHKVELFFFLHTHVKIVWVLIVFVYLKKKRESQPSLETSILE